MLFTVIFACASVIIPVSHSIIQNQAGEKLEQYRREDNRPKPMARFPAPALQFEYRRPCPSNDGLDLCRLWAHPDEIRLLTGTNECRLSP
jgi:hypothetical protein